MAGEDLTLAEVNEAIRHILATGQSYTTPEGLTFTNHDLDKLRAARDEIASRQASTQRGGAYGRVSFS